MARDVGDYGQNDFGPTILDSCTFLSPILSGVLRMFSSNYLPHTHQKKFCDDFCVVTLFVLSLLQQLWIVL